MKSYGLNELREMFLRFFETKEHLRLPSFSLIPQDDASLLLINSGMAPMKPYFKGDKEPPRHRICTCQKCIRTGDIENIGKTARHGTYFEMLGNFSFVPKQSSLQESLPCFHSAIHTQSAYPCCHHAHLQRPAQPVIPYCVPEGSAEDPENIYGYHSSLFQCL